MKTSTLELDAFNPGHVFACLGLAEAANQLCGPVRAGFEGSGPRVAFQLELDADVEPLPAVLDFLAEATVEALAPPGDHDLEIKKKVSTLRLPRDAPFPGPLPASPATLPARMSAGGRSLVVDYWVDGSSRDNFKLWAGAGGYPGAGLLQDALALARPQLHAGNREPLEISAPQSSSFRFDWRRDYVPLGIGFSLNNHGKKLTSRGYPLVEVLAALGMSHARPRRIHPRDKLAYEYGIPTAPALPLPLLRAALGGAPLPFDTRRFHITLDWPGKAGQARCITAVIEKTPSHV